MAKTSSQTKKSKSSSNSNGKKSSGSRTTREQEPLLDKFLTDMLKDIYWAEKHLTKALPKMAKAATTDELRQAFETHLEQTKQQISRLDQAFEMLGKKAQAKKCDAMEGLIKEAESIIEDTEDGSKTRDVALIVAAQKVEHYEIATYGSLVQIANTMQLNDVAELCGQTLQEEKDTDVLLTEIAENGINWEAEEAEGGSEGEDSEEA